MTSEIRLVGIRETPGHFQVDTEVAFRYPQLKAFAARVGGTHLAEFQIGDLTIFAKLEWENATGSVKDRVALELVHDCLKKFATPRRLLEYTSGSLGVSLAQICSLLKIPLTLVMSEATAPSIVERIRPLCEIEFTPKELSLWGAMTRAMELSCLDPRAHFLYSHQNPASLKAHLETGREILSQLNGELADAFVSSVGTGGTFGGVLKILRSRFPKLDAFTVSPTEMPFGTEEGPNARPKFLEAGGIGFGVKQNFVAEDDFVSHLHLSFAESRRQMLDVYKQTGLAIGGSSAANLLGCLRAARQTGKRRFVTIFPSEATREERLWLQARTDRHSAAI